MQRSGENSLLFTVVSMMDKLTCASACIIIPLNSKELEGYLKPEIWIRVSGLNQVFPRDIACRIVTNTGRYDHVTPALREIGWLPVEEHLKYREALITYKCMNGLAPPYLSKLFTKRNEIHDLNMYKE